MKKLFIAVICITFLSVATDSFAGKLRDNVGCGVGTLIFESAGQANGGWLLQMTASWTNGALSNTLSITTGTVGCRGSINDAVKYEKAYEFVTANIDNLAKDAAMGEGETLTSLAALLEVTDVATFGANIQNNFSTIFHSADVQSDEVLMKIIEVNS